MSVAAVLRRSPLSEAKTRLLADLTDDLDAASLWWLSGYAAGLAQRDGTSLASVAPAAQPAAAAEADARLSIVYGSQTGNAQRIATELAQHAQARGLNARLLRADAYPLRELKDERLLYVVISTQGDGDPPDDARGFVEFLASKRAPQLPHLQFAVLAWAIPAIRGSAPSRARWTSALANSAPRGCSRAARPIWISKRSPHPGRSVHWMQPRKR
jgi:sulfite reductase (NADPH) flavoprotein alpha-component